MSTFDQLSTSDGSLASMNISWLPNKMWSAITFATTLMLLVWGSVFRGYAWGPVRAVLRALPYGDKVGHFVLYGTITFALAMMVKTRAQAFAVGFGVTLLGVADEFRQLSTPNRNFSISDVLANAGGVCAGLLLVLLVARQVRATTESQ